MHALPVAEVRRQIAPRNSGSEPVKNGFNEQLVIRRRASDMAFATRQNILDPIPFDSDMILHQPNSIEAGLTENTP